jgi:hypothetical protein
MTTNGSVTKTTRRDRFASGAGVRLELSGGDWALVRQELTYGQQRRLANAGLSGLPPGLSDAGQGPALKVDWAEFELERLVTWLLDWSFTDADGDHVTVSREAVEALHPDTAQELNEALDRHIGALEAKKAPAGTGGTRRRATSSSASASAGAGTT